MVTPRRPPPDLAPAVPEWLTSEQRITLWAEALDAAEYLLLVGLRSQVGPEGDLTAAYRNWYSEYRRDYERGLFRMLDRLGHCEKNHGC
jgi:hypothetical protein